MVEYELEYGSETVSVCIMDGEFVVDEIVCPRNISIEDLREVIDSAVKHAEAAAV